MRRLLFGLMGLGCALIAAPALAQDPEPPGAADATADAIVDATDAGARVAALEERVRALEARLEAAAGREVPEVAAADAAERFTLGAWVEAYYAWNFNEPGNGITDLRGFDNRHDSFNLSNVAIDARWDAEGVNGRITLQWGSTPATYYLAETAAPSLGTGVGAQSISLWQFVQQAYAGYRVPIGDGLNVLAGLFLSPCGAEGMNVKDNWFYSRSNLFYGFPFYHTGLRVSYPVTPQLTVIGWVVNGWNTVLDNNDEKSVMLQATLSTDVVSGSLMYMTGVERPRGAPEGRAWRHLVDLNATATLTEWLAVQGQVTGMVEPNDLGTSGAFAGALALRARIVEWLYVAARGDFFWESVASSGAGTASAIFWPTEWVGSTTATIELRPHERVSFRIEYRHDHAAGPAYFRGAVAGDGATTPFVRNTRYQDTLTFGAAAWL